MTEYLLLLIGGMAAGFINTLASSGSAITLPIFLFLDFAPHVANATNRLNVLAASCASAVAFARQGKIDWAHVPHLLAPSVTGAILGAMLADWLPDRELNRVIILAVIMSLILVLAGANRFLRSAAQAQRTFGPLQMGLLLLVGIWAGLIVLDSYTYLLLTLVLAVGYDLVGANALKTVAGIGFCVAALVWFAGRAEVAWMAGGLMSLGSIVGAWLGAQLAASERSKVWVFRVLVITILGEIAHLLWR
ncbi:MAG: sulfite exporter TauE/SafE family protein [Candidatus Entotheonellia bacterium]